MFAQVISATLRIVFLQAGPGDFPFDTASPFTRLLVLFLSFVHSGFFMVR